MAMRGGAAVVLERAERVAARYRGRNAALAARTSHRPLQAWPCVENHRGLTGIAIIVLCTILFCSR